MGKRKSEVAKAATAERARLARMYNKRLATYDKYFGKGFGYNIVTDIDGIQFTKMKSDTLKDRFGEEVLFKGKTIETKVGGHYISATTFLAEDADDIIAELEKKLPAPKTKFTKMSKELGTDDLDKIITNILDKDKISARFKKAKDRFYDFADTKEFSTIYGTDPQVRRAYDMLFNHEGRYEDYSKMLSIIQDAEEALTKYGY